jgi:hypothetical protein
VNYLAKIRNTSEMIESKIKEHVAAEGHATEEKKDRSSALRMLSRESGGERVNERMYRS